MSVCLVVELVLCNYLKYTFFLCLRFVTVMEHVYLTNSSCVTERSHHKIQNETVMRGGAKCDFVSYIRSP